MIVNVLGTEYTILKSHAGDDTILEDADGYCDSTTKKIVLKILKETDESVEDLTAYEKKVTRHELIHAFLAESGLGVCSWGVNEEIVDWIALQFPKLKKAFEDAQCI